MEIRGLIALLLRRWLVIVPLLAVVVAGAGYAFATVPVRYEWTGNVILQAPKLGRKATAVPQEITETNSMLAYSPTLSTTAALLLEDVYATLKDVVEDPKEKIKIEREGPFLIVKVEGATEERTLALGASVFAKIDKALSDKQSELGAPQSTLITTQVVTAPEEAVKLGKARAAAVGGILGGGGLLTLITALAADSVFTGRRGRREAKAGSRRAMPAS